jgi:hypothetical protein
MRVKIKTRFWLFRFIALLSQRNHSTALIVNEVSGYQTRLWLILKHFSISCKISEDSSKLVGTVLSEIGKAPFIKVSFPHSPRLLNHLLLFLYGIFSEKSSYFFRKMCKFFFCRRHRRDYLTTKTRRVSPAVVVVAAEQKEPPPLRARRLRSISRETKHRPKLLGAGVAGGLPRWGANILILLR